uniref:Gamma-secretase subunit APH-1 n=1 Tax=Aquila chrysaetos chrysaetos TaxID=223781 RepID=A0A663FEW8_AQUCH
STSTHTGAIPFTTGAPVLVLYCPGMALGASRRSLSCRAFFWLVSLLLSSLIWFITVKASDPRDELLQKGLLIFGVMFSVLLQEAFRFLYYKLLRKAIEGLVALSEDGCSPISIQQMAYVAGVGFGLMSGTFSMINLLADALGPGTTGIHGDSQLYFLTSGERIINTGSSTNPKHGPILATMKKINSVPAKTSTPSLLLSPIPPSASKSDPAVPLLPFPGSFPSLPKPAGWARAGGSLVTPLCCFLQPL